jgi:hypothetical protein
MGALTPSEVKAVLFKIDYLTHLSSDSHLNDWELDFLINVESAVKSSHPFLTEKQLTKLDEVWEKY